MEKAKMIRHLEEIDEPSINRDGNIDPEEIDLLLNSYVPAIKNEIESGKFNKIVVISSDSQRSKQTTELLKEELSKQASVPVEQEINPRTCAEIHGKYKVGIDKSNPLVKKAKFTYLKESFEKGNMWYRYGSVTNDFDNETYPELGEIFESSGENQIELNIRMYRFILDLIKRIRENPKTLFVLSTHHIVMSTVLSLQFISENFGPLMWLSFHPQGELYKHENKATVEMIGGWGNFYNFYKIRNYVFDIDLSKLEKIEGIIQSELDIFLAKYMQHYGKII